MIQDKKYDDTLSLKIDKIIKIEIHSKVKLDLRKMTFGSLLIYQLKILRNKTFRVKELLNK
ncbi:MAG TPA: hypothetical protein DCW83_13965 [Saprospirales bacterium]|jgi:hypothetical protein|nr:hypothetical protein [Saprospirales bacterium]